MASVTSQIHPPTAFKLFELPADIFALILQRLILRDIVALSLSTKSLRHIYKPNNKDIDCARRAHLYFLGTQSSHSKPTHRCPYCSSPLCPPTCKSALFLDTNTGIFFPSSLWDTRRSRLAYHDNGRTKLPKWEIPHFGSMYSTIWCEHHRCPRDLFSMRNLHKTFGSQRFLTEYGRFDFNGSGWQCTREKRGQDPKAARWFSGYDVQSQDQLDALLRSQDKQTLAPHQIYEKKCYEIFCRHCFLQLNSNRRLYLSPIGAKSCNNRLHQFAFLDGVNTRGFQRKSSHKGCENCGFVIVQFNLINSFDSGWTGSRLIGWAQKSESEPQDRDYYLWVAAECKTVFKGFNVQEAQRLELVDPNGTAAALKLVRGRSVLNFPRPRIGIQDLPYKIIAQILEYVHEDWKDSSWYNALTSSYMFLKASHKMNTSTERPFTAEEVWGKSYRIPKGPGHIPFYDRSVIYM
ncbi:hypothetical protein TWF694_011427 [Orbilia ellipsospora]|uniref:F-box domain-containing protein n=1 Tax=Orbilia ellipsospora TaxID=2528407 RepID=A0AAV9X6K2_9PEZI